MNKLKWLRGIIGVRFETKYFEKIMNYTKNNNIQIWEVKYSENYVTGLMYANEYKKIKKIIKDTSSRCRIIKKTGFPFIYIKYSKRIMISIGVAVALFITFYMSGYLWDIECRGNCYYTSSYIKKLLESHGVVNGNSLNEIDCEQLENEIRSELGLVNWVCVRRSGVKLIVEIKEDDGTKVNDEPGDITDIIAPEDGIIDLILTRRGTPKVKKGDEVKAGDILVSNEVISVDEGDNILAEYSVKPEAKIKLKSNKEYVVELDKKYECRLYTGDSKKILKLRAFGRNFEICKWWKKYDNYDEYAVFEEGLGAIVIENKTQMEYEVCECEYTQEEARLILSEKYSEFLNKMQKKGVQIVDSSVKIEENIDKFRLIGNYIAIEQISD